MQERGWRAPVAVGLLLSAAGGCASPDADPTHVEDAGASALDAATMRMDASADADRPVDAGSTGKYDVYVLPGPDAEADAWTAPPMCNSPSGADGDGDGFPAPQDCNDCDALINPAAFDAPGNGWDEDCSGTADDERRGCDEDLTDSSTDARSAAQALGLCRQQSGSSWGLIDAKWVLPDGSSSSLLNFECHAGQGPHPLSHSLRDSYGPLNLPTEGAKLAVLSTGIAQPGMHTLGDEWLPASGSSPSATMCIASKPPPGFPKVIPECATVVPKPLINDGIALELTIKVPSNAIGFGYDFMFLTSEFPRFVCQGRSDHFVALLQSKHAAVPADGNISFDAKGNVVSVDTAFLEVCTPVVFGGRSFACSRGAQAIEGLGFYEQDSEGERYLQGAATGWLQTLAPIVPGETITLRLAIWDTQDTLADSTVLLDNLRWVIPERMAMPPPPPMKPVTTWVELL